ncbi:MAG TPA: rhamnogalacturonan acetylesterase [Pirellulales bacterium]|jgi:lysophospholipase L1-like esterase|nr:rhamnogalacturonan acetylesterase [Pirellulales bacterium]
MNSKQQIFAVAWIVALAGMICPVIATAAEPTVRAPENARPALYLIGDSTVNNSTKGLQGWGTPIKEFFDANRIRVENRARGGRSSRTYLTEGLWDQVRGNLRSGDFVVMQFGHNDGGPLGKPPNRASLKGTGDETQESVDPTTGKAETVHTYGWYLKKYVTDAKANGAVPIVLSPVPRNIWKEGKVARASGDYGKWAAEVARSEGVPFIDLNELIAARYEADGEQKVRGAYFTAADHTHTTPEGAKLSAERVVEGIRDLKDCALKDYLMPRTP